MTGVSVRDRWARGAILAAGLLAGAGLYAAHLDFAVLLFSTASLSSSMTLMVRRKPAFRVDGRSFTAVFARWHYVALVATLATVIGLLGLTADGRIDLLDRIFDAGVLVVTAALLVVAVRLLWQPPGVSLTVEGITWHNLIRSRMFRWEDLTGPVEVRRWEGIVTLVVNGMADRIVPGALYTDHRFIADAVEYYRTHPEHRAAIGTIEEHQRLDGALHEWYNAYWRWRLRVPDR